jgi:hypothetical protein
MNKMFKFLIIKIIIFKLLCYLIGGDDMAMVYATLIIKGKRTLDSVPALIKPQVIEILADLEVEVDE